VFICVYSKLISVVPSLFSSAYVLNWPTYFEDVELKVSDAPSFDARATPYPLEKEIHDYLSWRQEDCEFCLSYCKTVHFNYSVVSYSLGYCRSKTSC